MKSVFYQLKFYKKESILGPLFKLSEASFELFVPLVVAKIIDVGIKNSDREYTVKMCLALAGLAAAGLICSVTAQYFAARAATGCTARLSRTLFEKIQKLDFPTLDKAGISTLITRMTGDISQVQTGVNLTLRLLLRSPFVVFGAMLMAFTVDVKSALIFAVAIPLLSVAVFGVMLRCISLYKKVQGSLDRVTLSVRENLSGVRVLRAFNKQEEQTAVFDERNSALTAIQIFTGRISSVMNPVTFVMINAAAICLLYTGAVRVDTGRLQTGEVVALYNYMSQILVELVKLANLIINITKSAASANRIDAILRLPEQENGTVESLSDSENAVCFNNVSLQYDTAAAQSLSDISFCVKRDQTVGIIGATGSGKTSLVNLIPGFYKATNGEVLLFGENVNNISRALLNEKIAVVPQHALLFRGTVRENLLWGNKNAADEELYAALRAAQAEDIILSKENGLDFMIEQGGKNLSGGQRQRLTIARALVKKAEIMILDDSASALDFVTESKLRKALSELENSPAVFIVSQRTSSIRHADFIIVLDDGKCIGQGTHDELLSACPVYREIHETQFGGAV
ncbi:MAG: ABC transporter ATP-binding protein/permease [Clostridia bacterium]|nr:ABC transporter ATP-binding protein/permease [Clostridia bacterium]